MPMPNGSSPQPIPKSLVPLRRKRSAQARLTAEKGCKAFHFKGNHQKIFRKFKFNPFQGQSIQNPKSSLAKVGIVTGTAKTPTSRKIQNQVTDLALRRLIFGGVAAVGLIFLLQMCQSFPEKRSQHDSSTGLYGTVPLVMKGGDPYIRALMRTISASESNLPHPYSVIYGGQQVSDLRRHPNQCVTIVTGPNAGNCSTAAGRYQMLNRTWYKLVQRYHPKPERMLFWTGYSFEPEYQDAVVYAWLSDRQVWGVDIAKQLRRGKLDRVLRLLSGTWTSLGYGIETNSMSRKLPKIYQNILQEELQAAGS